VQQLRRGRITDRAARLVPVCVVLDMLNIPNPGTPPEGVSVKVACPFQELHPQDRSGEKDMRIYGDGKAYCHMCAEGWDSVALAAKLWEVTRVQAARQLLAAQGLEVTAEDEVVATVTPAQLRSASVAALGIWADANGVDRFSERYVRCLGLADQIQTAEHVDAWLSACKTFLGEHNA
jgi:hypothetical protein